MTELADLNLAQLISALRTGEVSSVELTTAYLERIQRLEPKIHAFLHLAGEQALQRAHESDRRRAAWRKGVGEDLPPLLGLPIAVKDTLCVEGMPCTCASRILEGYRPPYNATAIERLLSAGAIIVGKTNTDEFAMGSSTEHSAFGVTHNPWDLERVPGGSSGGSAAAVAARLVPAALGSDTGGSVRHPAAFCGVTAIKPTYGRVSRYGLVAFGSSLDVIGVLGKTVQDTAAIFQVIAGCDHKDSTTLDIPVPDLDLNHGESRPLEGVRIGVADEYFVSGMQADVERAVHAAIKGLEGLGAVIVPVSLPHTQYALPVYYILAPAEASANLARYDGIRYGQRAPAEDLWAVFCETRGELFGPEVKRRIMLGTYALSAGYYDAYYGQAQKVRTLIRQDFENVFGQCDLIAAPVTPTTAFRIGEHFNDPLAMYLEDIFTLPANLAGVPALTFPVGFDRTGMPIGMQLMAPHFQEERLFRVGHAYQQITGWQLQNPALK